MSIKTKFLLLLVLVTLLFGTLYQYFTEENIVSAPVANGDRVSFFALGDQGSGRYRQHAVAWFLEREC